MRVLIVEDEIVAANRLKKMLQDYDGNIQVVEVIDNVVDSINFLSNHNPDLIFMDVQLSYGKCFELFDEIEVDTPIIFTTAYDEYTLKAFKVNSIDYLLKPVHPKELGASLDKFKKYRSMDTRAIEQTLKSLVYSQTHYKCRFLVKSGRGFISIEVRDIAYFLSENKLTYLMTHEGKKYFVDKSLEQVEQLLNPLEFQKVNRNFIVSHKAIQKIEPYFNNRLLLQVEPPLHEHVFVNRSYLKDFKAWVDR